MCDLVLGQIGREVQWLVVEEELDGVDGAHRRGHHHGVVLSQGLSALVVERVAISLWGGRR
jgi:hypothetical protein